MQKWEYFKYFTSEHPKQLDLNSYGEEGWELVVIMEATTVVGKGFLTYLKRPKATNSNLSAVVAFTVFKSLCFAVPSTAKRF